MKIPFMVQNIELGKLYTRNPYDPGAAFMILSGLQFLAGNIGTNCGRDWMLSYVIVSCKLQ